MANKTPSLRDLPSVDRVVGHPDASALLSKYSRDFVTQKTRQLLDDLRQSIRRGDRIDAAEIDERAILARIARGLDSTEEEGLVPVVNATGTILHTNLGRALLAQAALKALNVAAERPLNLEYDLESGRRGRREHNIEKLLLELTGAEAASVVNNNAAAVLLALNTVAQDKEVIVSRGELIEIGGSFRIPEIMAKSGAVLREVGTTNRTHPEDYEKAIGEKTALLLKVHTSNYRVVGFVAEVSLSQLVAIGQQHRIPVMEDLGSGALVDLSRYGLPKEPLAAEQVAAGADIVTFSGDKILGGPQAGLVVGKKRWVEAMNKNPLKRALRCGKLTLAALEATLKIYQRSPEPAAEIPTLRAFTRPLEEIEAMGRKLLPRLQEALGAEFTLTLEDGAAQIGSGALPTEEIPSKVIAIRHPALGAEKIARRFREARPPIIGRVRENRFLLDLRAIFDAEELIPHF
ncbi:MAG TPA: L-seryl-tRNA(Sec) selenium transferase [Candidatus Acidoferrales bacterium]|nr:L-seryl-tRNA(Sec) selenium transferase [Candidatus Acidoferrales bacterium]